MKAVFLLLLSINLAYLGWRTWIVPAAAPPAMTISEDVPRLVLIGEDPDDPVFGEPYTPPEYLSDTDDVPPPDESVQLADDADAAVVGQSTEEKTEDAAEETAKPVLIEVPAGINELSAPPEVALVQAGLRCVSLGPFLNLREATEATAMLNEAGLDPSQRLSESQVWFGHWVHLPPYKTRSEAVAVVENLRKNGVTDIYIEPSGPMQNSVSLGVFSEREHAETRAGAIRKYGIRPQIRDRYRDSSVYWVDFEMPEGQVIDPTQYQAAPNRVLRIEGRTCPADT